MATTDIGRAVPLLRGEYDPAQTYELNDIVSLNGSLYWHYSHEVTTNVAPQATSTWKIVLSLTDAEAYIARAETAAEEAESAKDDAVTAKTAAETASTTATGASEAATAAKDDAVTARNAAQTAETGAVEAKNAAVSAKEAAQSAASSAGTSATSAGNSAGTAEYYAENAETAAETATTKASEASASATTASSAATAATEAKNTAVSSASTATTKAGEASTSATSAASSAAAAQAVKDSIPEDYSELSEDVSDLKTQLEDNLAVDVISIAGLENGNINTLGENRESTTRIRTIDKITVKAGHFVDVICGENQTYIIGVYNGNTYTTYGWYTKNIRLEIENDCKIRFLIRYVDEAEITPADNKCILQIFPPMWNKLQAMAEDTAICLDTIIDAITPVFEQGQIIDGIGIAATDRARTVDFIPVTENTIFHFNTFYKRAKFSIYYYSTANESDYITGSQDYFATDDLYLQSKYTGYAKIRYWFQPLATINANELTSIGGSIRIINPAGVLDRIAKETEATTETVKINCESGTILGGYPAENANYCRADGFYPVNKGDIIHFDSLPKLLRITIQEYDENKSSSLIFATNNIDIFANGDGYNYTVENYGYIKFRATYIPSEAMTQDDISLVSSIASYITSISQRKAVSDSKPEAEYFVKTVSHRGYYNAPENTIIAYKLAKINGFKYVETDVRFTSDGVAVLLHDDTINRTARNADGTSISSTIKIADITYAQALTYDFGLYKGADYAGTKIPLFSDFIALCRNIGLIPFIELKAGTPEQITELFSVVRAHALHRDCWWTSGTGALLNYIIAVDDMANISYSPNPFVLTNILNFKTGKNKVIAELNTSIITNEVAEQCAENEIELMEWPINIDDTILNSNPYVSWYLTNKPIAGKVLYINAIKNL